MIDLTPLEVRKKKGDFKRTMRGYEPGLVDDFLDLVADRLEEVVRENMTHAEKLRELEQQVRDYRERERALTDALVSAQELREEMRAQSTREAELARRGAEQDAERIRAGAVQQRAREEQNLRQLRARQAQFLQTYRNFLERELNEVGVIGETLGYASSSAPATAGDDEVEEASLHWPEAPGAELAAASEAAIPAHVEAPLVPGAIDYSGLESVELDAPLLRADMEADADVELELRLEDAVDEAEPGAEGPEPVADWLPKLIEEEP
jgi:DivIVA domain-containing protein